MATFDLAMDITLIIFLIPIVWKAGMDLKSASFIPISVAHTSSPITVIVVEIHRVVWVFGDFFCGIIGVEEVIIINHGVI
jgi:hypothetical protein